jgi:hypothetical protein
VEAYDTPTRRPGQGRRHRHWTADEDRVLREAQRAGHDLDELRAELAAQLNRTVAEVKTRRAQLAARGELA